jgi:hypothetical protein
MAAIVTVCPGSMSPSRIIAVSWRQTLSCTVSRATGLGGSRPAPLATAMRSASFPA